MKRLREESTLEQILDVKLESPCYDLIIFIGLVTRRGVGEDSGVRGLHTDLQEKDLHLFKSGRHIIPQQGVMGPLLQAQKVKRTLGRQYLGGKSTQMSLSHNVQSLFFPNQCPDLGIVHSLGCEFNLPWSSTTMSNSWSCFPAFSALPPWEIILLDTCMLLTKASLAFTLNV